MTRPTAVGEERFSAGPDPWHRRHRRVLGLLGAGAAAGMTALWVVVVPDKADAVGGVQRWAVLYGHPAAWACLTGLGIAVAEDAPRSAREALAWSALGSYAAFVLALTL